MTAAIRFLAIAAGAALLFGCASRDLVVVLPESDGHVGAVSVGTGSNEVLLDKAYRAAHPGQGSNPAKAFTVDPARVNRIFGPALAALPAAPRTFRLYFKNDSTELTPESAPKFEQVFADIARRPAPEIVVTGHTDTVGKVEDKDQLSLDRARAVSELFVQRGISRTSITIAGRGDRELAVATNDQVPEPRNRRVEVTVR
jgi:outer membrane protein OmpA-like peptidoglycan-associated protein